MIRIDTSFKTALDKEIGEMRLDPRIIGRAVAAGRARKARRRLAASASFFAALAASALLLVCLLNDAGKNNALGPVPSGSGQPTADVSSPPLSPTPSPSPSPFPSVGATSLTRFHSGGKVGFRDAAGNVAIAAEYALATDFNEYGVAVVSLSLDRSSGLALLGPEGLRTGYDFDDVGIFSEGLAVVKKGDLYGYIDASGRVVVEPRFTEARAFSRGLAAAAEKKHNDIWDRMWDTWGFIDASGKYVIDPQYSNVSSFAEDGTAIVRIMTPPTEDEPSGITLSGAVDLQGNMILPVEYYSLGQAWQGIRVASRNLKADKNSGYHLQGLIDEKGNWLVQPQFFEMGSVQNGLVTANVVKNGSGYAGILKTDGTWLYEPTHQSVFAHTYGLIVFSDRTSADDPGTMVLYGEKGNKLLGGKSYNHIDIVNGDYVCCRNMNRKGETVSSRLLRTDGKPPVEGAEIIYGYELGEKYAAADTGTFGDGYGLKDKDAVWRNSYGILGESGWIVEPRYNQVLYFDGERGRGVRIVPEESNDAQIAYMIESFDAAGTITDNSGVEYASEAEYNTRMYAERNYFVGGHAINRLDSVN